MDTIGFPPACSKICGRVAEWLKAHARNACLRESVTWVRIPILPPVYNSYCQLKPFMQL
jgi:hypothetical protein